jgi:3-hydroxybutyryl-CoA dehydratase
MPDLDPKPIPVQHGLCFEDFEAGQGITSQGRTITEADIVAFAALSGDWNPIHTDAVYAASQPLGQRVAHGLLGMSIASALAMRLGFLEETLLAFREIEQWKFSLPLLIGDTVHVHITILETRPVPRLRGGLVTLGIELLNQEERITQHGRWSVLVKSKPG